MSVSFPPPVLIQRKPFRFFIKTVAWRSIAWVALLGVVAPFLLISTVVLLPIFPVVARITNRLGRYGAYLLGVRVPDRQPSGWFDWPLCVMLVSHLVLSVASMVVSSVFITGVTSSLLVPVAVIFDPPAPGFEYHFLLWATSSTTWAVLSALFIMIISSVALVYLSWLIARLSLHVTISTNSDMFTQVERLEQSRDILIDAFTGERRRIERELHDGVQQYLTALQLSIATIELKAAQSEDFSEQMAQARLNSQRALEALRSTVRGIYPQVLQDKGLVEALRELVAHSGLEGQVTCSNPQLLALLDATRALLLYHCAAEGITNAMRHGGASTIAVCLEHSITEVQLTIADNGSGCADPADSTDTEGTGVAGLKERARALGGSVVLTQSNTLGGACLRMSLPVPESVLP